MVQAAVPHLTVRAGGPWDRASDPWVAFGRDDRVYYASLLFNETTPDNALGVSMSTDGGRSWGAPVEVIHSTKTFNDKEAIVVDTSPSSAYRGSVYVAWDIGPGGDRDNDEGEAQAMQGKRASDYKLVVARSADLGATWSRPVVIRKKKVNIGAIPRVGPDGTVYVVWSGKTSRSTYWIFFSKSADGGKTWSKPVRVAEDRLANVANLRSGAGLPSFDVDPSSGALYVAWCDKRWTGVSQVTMAVSRDGGATWSEPKPVSDAPDDAPCFTTSIAATSTGGVAVSYYDLQNDPQRKFLADVYVCISRDGGATFDPAQRITPTSFDVRNAAFAGAYFLGDYTGLVGTDTAYDMLWVAPLLPSARDASRLQPDVFTVRVEASP